MEHVAIDLGGEESQVCRRGSDGKVLKEERIKTAELGAYLARLSPSVVTMETCAEAFVVADKARTSGHEVRVVPASLVKSLGVGAHGVKNDRRDARALSAASCRMAEELPSVHVPSKEARERKALSGMRDALVSSRTRLINTVRGWLRAEARRVPSGQTETFGRRVRALAEESQFELPGYVQRQLVAIESLDEQIALADKEMEQLAKSDARCRLLMTVSGFGPVVSVMFAAVLDDVHRFREAAQLASYLGLTPGEDSSSDRQRRTRITKAGSSSLRRLLVQSAHVMRRCRPDDPLVVWARRIEERRGKRIAVVAIARKLAMIGWAMLRDGKPYEPRRAAKAPPPEQQDTSLAEELRTALRAPTPTTRPPEAASMATTSAPSNRRVRSSALR